MRRQPAPHGAALAVLLVLAILWDNELRLQRYRTVVAGADQRRGQQGVMVFHHAIAAFAGRAVRTVQLGRTVILRAIQRDQQMAPEDAQLVDRTGPLQFGERGGDRGVELLRLDRVEHGADLIVAGDPVHREQGLAVGPSMARRQMPLMRQEGRALHEKRGERRHAEIGHGVDRVPPLPLVGDRQAATANGSDQAVRRGGHPATESTKSPRRKPSSACRRRLSQTVAFETQRPTSATQLANPASRSRSAADRQNEKCRFQCWHRAPGTAFPGRRDHATARA